MPKRILVPVDGSDCSADALAFAATEWPDAELVLLHVINPARSASGSELGMPGAVEQWYENATTRSETILSNAAGTVDRDVETLTEVGSPGNTIREVAEAEDVDLIVIGSHGRTGVSRVLLGSVAEGVVRKASVPVTVVR
ncbi:universal stress protein [Halopenitus persicus]|uniref:Nucleotide-binding universal stress protein, UspA family n=1 Tax=Halopenitus persicus TaxID=1048396 RepID=A0A1H3N498_9EURY|nr:universal stress protein [Halopenitus persicus]QHS17758.1 universal stress protein [haloarchaeon 3A1-DGR]SDY83069.1 Nucleotide-binding universal stress protein, UspA family [Halopenitus persicus]